MTKNNRSDLRDKLDFNADDPVFGGSAKSKANPKTDNNNDAAQSLPEGNSPEQPKRVRKPRKMGRPLKDFPEEVLTKAEAERRESDYLGNDETLPFSTSLTADNYLTLKRMEYHQDVTMTNLINEAVAKFVKRQESAKKPLPQSVVDKLNSG